MSKIKDLFDPSYEEFRNFTLDELKEWDYRDVTFKKLNWFAEHELVKSIEFIALTSFEKALFYIYFYKGYVIEVYTITDK